MRAVGRLKDQQRRPEVDHDARRRSAQVAQQAHQQPAGQQRTQRHDRLKPAHAVGNDPPKQREHCLCNRWIDRHIGLAVDVRPDDAILQAAELRRVGRVKIRTKAVGLHPSLPDVAVHVVRQRRPVEQRHGHHGGGQQEYGAQPALRKRADPQRCHGCRCVNRESDQIERQELRRRLAQVAQPPGGQVWQQQDQATCQQQSLLARRAAARACLLAQ